MASFSNIRKLFSIHETEHAGFDEAEITALESQLAIQFPGKLREYYLSLGKHENLNYVHNRLLKPGREINFSDDGYLVFYEENQVVVYWGIKREDLHLENPPVYGNSSPGGEAPDWYLEAQTVEDFLLLMAVYNGTFGGLQYNANSLQALKTDVVDYIRDNWSALEQISFDHQKVYTDNYQEVISISFNLEQNATAVFIGTSNQVRFDRLLELLDVDWSYISYEDEDGEEEEDRA